MAHCFERIIKSMNQTKEEMVAEHGKRVLAGGNPSQTAPLPEYGPAPATPSLTIPDLDLFSPEPGSHISLRSLVPAINEHSQTDLVAEDATSSSVFVRFNSDVFLPEGTFFTVKTPMLETFAGRVGLIVSREQVVAHRNEDLPLDFGEEYFWKLAKQLQHDANPAKGLESGQRGLTRNPTHPGLLQVTGECCLSMGLFHLAYETAVKALLVAPAYAPFRLILVEALTAMGRVEEAEGQISLLGKVRDHDLQVAALRDMIERKKVAVREESAAKEEARHRIHRELVLVEWPRLISPDKIKRLMDSYGIPVPRVTLKGKTAILAYDSIDARERARVRLMEIEDCEFMLANEPARYRL